MATSIRYVEDPQFECARSEQLLAQDVVGKSKPHKDSRCCNADFASATVDFSAVSSRCSAKLIHEIVARFSPEQVGLVRSIGFDGLLHMPMLKQINLRFSYWLMSRVDELSQTLLISDDCRIPFDKSDVAKVFGIPSSGKSILCSSNPVDSYTGSAGGSINTEQLRSLKSAQAIVSRCYGGIMSSVEQEEFKAAFVVVVMSALLAPSAKHDRVGDDYMHAIAYPSDISSYDWSEYVIRRLLDAVSKLKLDIANNVKCPYIYGCSLFLQVLYLDSIELGALSMPHNVYPRIRCFTADRLRSMIVVVSSISLNGMDTINPRGTKLRSSEGICYYWASCQLPGVCVVNDSSMVHLWDAVLLTTRVLKIPLEAAGPLFVAAAEIQRRKRSQFGTEAMENLCVLLHIMEPFVNGFRYQSSFNVNDHPSGLCPLRYPHICSRSDCCLHIGSVNLKRTVRSAPVANVSQSDIGFGSSSQIEGRGSKRRHSPIQMDMTSSGMQCSGRFDMFQQNDHASELRQPIFFESHDFDLRAINAMARFYLTLRPVRATRCTDLNLPPRLDAAIRSTIGPRSPWELGCIITIDGCRAAELRRKLLFVEDIDEPWIVHFCPKYIEVLTGPLKAQIMGQSEFEMELFDAVIRRYKQVDDDLYSNQSNLRWRHFVESDFMVSLLAGWFDIADPVVRSHFCSRHLDYDVTACEMMFFPVLMQHRWVCFAWRMKDNTIVVYDPFLSVKSSSASSSSYESVAGFLKSAMSLVASQYFPWWTNEWDKAAFEIFKPTPSEDPGINRSGLLCLYFCRCFNGQSLVPPLTEGLLENWASMVLGDVLDLSGNLGSVPHVFR